MNFAFEAALISVLIGAILSVLLPSGLLSGVDEDAIPSRTRFALRAIDIWLAVVFGLVALVLFDVVLEALSNHKPLSRDSREACLHLLALLAVYPAFTALGKRTLPILYTSVFTDRASPRLEIAVLTLPLVALSVAAELLPVLLNPTHSFSTDLLLIASMGILVVGPCVLIPVLGPWRSRRLRRRARIRARDRRLAEQTVVVTVPHGDDILIRAFFDMNDPHSLCWVDRCEADRVVALVSDAAYRARREGMDVTQTDHWWVHAWPNRRLSVRHGHGRSVPRHEWRYEDGCLFEGRELLLSLAARMPLSARAAS